ncbi:Dyp-type peroxidase [Micromonospora sp. WMMD714]|uniref:Dyp-type peroxidase n=1 Tax=Micromonospora sp. WMMD714 TaxID=3016097 RepID=UPI00249C7A48|nr:Dyp-type peroxidase [Micromonospora sp. WMMD714]WFE66019.1 Dyp-type peroxidase [Micromonospora sp. WMMD714]
MLTAPPASARFTAFDVRIPDRTALTVLLRDLGELADTVNGRASGRASVTVGFGVSLFDSRFGLATLRPGGLRLMDSFPNDALDPEQCHGDLLVQVCADGPETVARIGRDLLAAGGGGLRSRWSIDGFRSENQTSGSGAFVDRNLFGFRDGAGNPRVNDADLMDRLVWAGAGEPGWAVGGTYQVIRLVRFATALWDVEPVGRQEEVFGRSKATGAPLGRQREDDEPDYAQDPDGMVIRLDAHIRRANPRTPQTEDSRILRRGYAYRRTGVAGEGHPDEGLVFVCFQADLDRGFVSVQRRLAGEALDKYVLTFGGGYFFVPPSRARVDFVR